jgi:hypothetical protein
MRRRLRALRATLAGVAMLAGGCALPSTGSPVFVESGTGRWWSGEAVLTEVSEDRQRCLVHARNNVLIVEKKWVDCRRVHDRRPELPPPR